LEKPFVLRSSDRSVSKYGRFFDGVVAAVATARRVASRSDLG
jgi:phosphatidylglycerophosphatase A